MSAPIDARPGTTPTAPVIVLTADEQRILAAFRKMDTRRKRENLALLESDGADYPAHPAPRLRLVGGGVA